MGMSSRGHKIVQSVMPEWLQAYGTHSPSDDRFSIVVATFTNSSGVLMSS